MKTQTPSSLLSNKQEYQLTVSFANSLRLPMKHMWSIDHQAVIAWQPSQPNSPQMNAVRLVGFSSTCLFSLPLPNRKIIEKNAAQYIGSYDSDQQENPPLFQSSKNTSEVFISMHSGIPNFWHQSKQEVTNFSFCVAFLCAFTLM